jgi:hypothetical protein
MKGSGVLTKWFVRDLAAVCRDSSSHKLAVVATPRYRQAAPPLAIFLRKSSSLVQAGSISQPRAMVGQAFRSIASAHCGPTLFDLGRMSSTNHLFPLCGFTMSG